MYDTLKLWLNNDDIKDSRYLQKIPTLLSNVSEHQTEYGNYITGNKDNLKISCGPTGISINGSINKFWHKDNFNKLTKQQTELSITKISDFLNTDVSNAKVNRIDLAHNFIMNEQPKNYYHLLGPCNRYKRIEQPKSVYYSNKLRTKLFYNKIAEGKSKNEHIPKIWLNKNVLRYELRYTKRLPKQFNTDYVKAKDLYNELFYIDIIDNWTKEYFEIKKNKLFTPTKMNLTNRNAKEFLLSALIELVGHNEVRKLTENWKDNFSTTKENQRFKKSLTELKGLTKESDLIKELDTKILTIKEYYR